MFPLSHAPRRLYNLCKNQQADLQTQIKLTRDQHQLREHENLEGKWEHQLEIINKGIHEIFTNFQYLYLEKVLPNQPCE